MGTSYPSEYRSFKVPESVKIYFHNVWSDNFKREFEEILQAVVAYYIDKIVGDANTVASLICLSDHIPYSNPFKKEIKEEWERSAIERMGKFSIKELKKALDKSKSRDWGSSGHG